MALIERKRILRSSIPPQPCRVLYADFAQEGTALYQAAVERDLEGVVSEKAVRPLHTRGDDVGKGQESELQPGRGSARVVRIAARSAECFRFRLKKVTTPDSYTGYVETAPLSRAPSKVSSAAVGFAPAPAPQKKAESAAPMHLAFIKPRQVGH